MNQHKRLPIIILNWNGLEDTIECMTSLSFLKGDAHEIILVDNGSDNQEAQVLQQMYGSLDNVTLICNDTNKGFTKGNADIVMDILQRAVLPEFVVLLNNDTVVVPSWLEQLVKSAQEHRADIISSKMIDYYDRSKIDNVGHFMLNTGEILPLGHGDPIAKYEAPIENLGACGGAAMYRTSMIKEIGFFDPYFNTGYEDAEYGLRAKLLGYTCWYEPKAVVYHKVSRSIKKVMDEAFLQRIQTNIFYTYIKLMPKKFLTFNLGFAFVKYVLLLFVGIFTFKFGLLKTHTKTIAKYFTKDLWRALALRDQFYNTYGSRIRYQHTLLKPTQFFAANDLKRLLRRRAI